MTWENRYINFSESELLSALQTYSAAAHAKLGYGMKYCARVEADPELRVLLDVVDEMGTVRHKEVLGKASVVAALMKYCMANGIPVPKLGFKDLKPCDRGVSLFVTLRDGAAEA